MRTEDIPLFGGINDDDAKQWARLDPVNWIPEIAEGLNRSGMKLADAPGLETKATLPGGVVRGLYGAQGRLYAVGGTTLYEVRPDYTLVVLGTIPGVGRVGAAHNQRGSGNEVD